MSVQSTARHQLDEHPYRPGERVYAKIGSRGDAQRWLEFAEIPATVEFCQHHPARGHEVLVTLDYNPRSDELSGWAFPLDRVRRLEGPPRVEDTSHKKPER